VILPAWQRTLYIVFLSQLISAIGFSTIFPFLSLYVQDLGTNTSLGIEFWTGMIFSAQAATMMVAAPIWGVIADRYGRKLMVERASFGGALIIFLMAFARSAEELTVLRAIQGMLTGVVSANNALVASSAPRERMGFAMGTVQVGLWSGVAIGPMIGGFIADTLGFQAAFIVTAALLLLSGVLVWLGVEEHADHQTQSLSRKVSFVAQWRQILATAGVGVTLLMRFSVQLGRMLVSPFAPLFLEELMATAGPMTTYGGLLRNVPLAAGAPVSTYAGLMVGLASVASTFSAIYLGRLGDRVGHKRILVGSALAATLAYLPQSMVTDVWQLLILQMLAGAAAGGLVSAPAALLANYTEPGGEGAVYGLDNSIVAAGRAAAPLLGSGVVVLMNLRGIFTVTSGLMLITAALAFWLLPKTVPVACCEPAASPQPAD
jgi:DHA1 family multidrug resistance protein-like MFS transporter